MTRCVRCGHDFRDGGRFTEKQRGQTECHPVCPPPPIDLGICPIAVFDEASAEAAGRWVENEYRDTLLGFKLF